MINRIKKLLKPKPKIDKLRDAYPDVGIAMDGIGPSEYIFGLVPYNEDVVNKAEQAPFVSLHNRGKRLRFKDIVKNVEARDTFIEYQYLAQNGEQNSILSVSIGKSQEISLTIGKIKKGDKVEYQVNRFRASKECPPTLDDYLPTVKGITPERARANPTVSRLVEALETVEAKLRTEIPLYFKVQTQS